MLVADGSARLGRRAPYSGRSNSVNQESNVTTTALSCGNARRCTQPDHHGVRWIEVPALPGKADIDPVLASLEGRLLVQGTDADLAAVILRLLRANRLADVIVGYLPVVSSPASSLWRIPVGPAALDLACTGAPRPVPVIRDDGGGVLAGAGVIPRITGEVYCDDQRALRGSALAVEVAPDPGAAPLPDAAAMEPATEGVRVSVVRRGLLRRKREVFRGRAVQASFRSTTVLRDGVAHQRPTDRWGWYRHTEDLLFVCPRS
jgi:hypothetical protein